ncbi:hypothetical protein [Pontibacter sp. H249]|uniref:hypothetical protein n=1 Tax=Pontibacter sp. H249 TaxID=3133420 RepID=UPI0030C3E08E
MSANLKNTRKSLILFIFALFSLTSCELIEAVDQVVVPNFSSGNKSGTYVIKKGKHYSNNKAKKLKAEIIRIEATFDSSAVYTTSDPKNQADINKLYGMSDCKTKHHTNSARFGWRWYNNQLEILAYTYVNKKREFKLIRAVEIGQPVTYELKLEDNQYVFTVNGTKVVMPRSCNGTGDGYLLYPYFGGDETAPHTIKIAIKNLI